MEIPGKIGNEKEFKIESQQGYYTDLMLFRFVLINHGSFYYSFINRNIIRAKNIFVDVLNENDQMNIHQYSLKDS